MFLVRMRLPAIVLTAAALSFAAAFHSAVAAEKGVALTIGLNSIDPSHYGSEGTLYACENDARDMAAIATARGFEVSTLLTRDATRKAILKAMHSAADELEPDSIFMISYSGHGGQVHDFNGDEKENNPRDTLDETWCLYDGQMIDDELYAAYGKFRAGVRILVFSDSCHSGTVTKSLEYERLAKSGTIQRAGREAIMDSEMPKPPTNKQGDLGVRFTEFMANPDKPGTFRDLPPVPSYRNLPFEVAFQTFVRNHDFYENIGNAQDQGDRATIQAAVLLISGCQDNQLSLDGWVNGLFTGNLRKVWGEGAFDGDYRAFHQVILDEMPGSQSPNYYFRGTPNPEFESQRPFTISPTP